MADQLTVRQLYNMHYVDFMSITEIASIAGVSKQAISARFKKLGLKILSLPYKGRDNPNITNKDLLLETFKSSKSYVDICTKLGIEYHCLLRWLRFHKLPKYKFERRGSSASGWINGSTKDKKGYIWVNAFENKYLEFNPNWRSHQVLEHKRKFEMEVLGFPLSTKRQWHIHHIDENIENNSLDNLALLSAQEHTKIHSILREIKEMYPNTKSFEYSFHIEKVRENVLALSKANVEKAKANHTISNNLSLESPKPPKTQSENLLTAFGVQNKNKQKKGSKNE